MITIAIAEDQVLFRKGLIALLNKFDNVEIVCDVNNGRELLDYLGTCTQLPDICLLDISMPEKNGLQTINEIKALFPVIKNIILSVHDDEKIIIKFIEAGANAYLLKTLDIEELKSAIDSVYEKDFYFNQNTLLAMNNMYKYSRSTFSLSQVDLLTAREKEVIQLICEEFTNGEIASKLHLSERTVEGHRNRILSKTNARNTAGLVIFAIKNNLYNI